MSAKKQVVLASLLTGAALCACLVLVAPAVAAWDETPKTEAEAPKAADGSGKTDRASESAAPTTESDRPEIPTTTVTGSGKAYKTTVHRETSGELDAEDFRQSSLLASRIVLHLSETINHIRDERLEDARGEIERGLSLVSVVRDILPTTTVTTVVEDAEGNEVYRYVDQVQDDWIPMHEGLIAVEVLEPISEAKEDAAVVKGVRLADAELLQTSVRLDLSLVERKLSRAKQLLDEDSTGALNHLLLALTRGVKFSLHEQDSPLVDAQHALQIAERMVKQGRHEAARTNLQVANHFLGLYRSLISTGESEEVQALEEEITELQSNLDEEGSAGVIRGFWDRVTSWFVEEPGDARSSEENPESTS